MNEINKIDEKSYQEIFYANLEAAGFKGVDVNMSTDGYTENVFFEHKKNATAFGTNKAIGQAIIYMTKLNMKGIPVPGTIAIVSQQEKKIYLYKTERYKDYINDIEHNSRHNASVNADSIDAAECFKVIEYTEDEEGWTKLATELKKIKGQCKVKINKYNVVGWSKTFYDRDKKAKKNQFFNILKSPAGFMANYIEPWTGAENDFKEVMDLLNDPATQKQLGAFYTPDAYAKEAAKMLRRQIKAWTEKYPGDDYLIIDRCAGSGNLEAALNPNELKHCIVNTYELKEWIALRYRIGKMVRELMPPIPEEGEPEHEGQFLTGSDALSESFCERLKKSIKDNATTEHYGIFFFENPPYGESGAKSLQDSLSEEEKGKRAGWKDSYVITEMKKAGVKGTATNDMANAFIWSAFNMFMHEEDDGYVVFSPIKYWKVQHLINKKYLEGFLANRKEFHASEGAISVISWKNEDSNATEFNMHVCEIVCGDSVNINTIECKHVNKTLAETMYDKRTFNSDTNGIPGERDGLELSKEVKIRIKPIYNNNIIGYMAADTMMLSAQAGANSTLTTLARFNGNGFYLREDNFIEKLPMFAAGFYTKERNKWYEKEFLAKTGDCKETFEAAVKSGEANDLLVKSLIYTMYTQNNHLCSFKGSDGRDYKNKIAPRQNSLADAAIARAVSNGYKYSEHEIKLNYMWDKIWDEVIKLKEYDSDKTYGLYQIEQEINVSVPDADGKMIKNYGNLNNAIKSFKTELNKYYVEEVGPLLLQYGFIK